MIRSLGSLVGTDQDISTILSALRQVVGNNIELRRQVNELATSLQPTVRLSVISHLSLFSLLARSIS